MAEREGWTVVAEFSDEGFSGFSGNRGPGLVGARSAAAYRRPGPVATIYRLRNCRQGYGAPAVRIPRAVEVPFRQNEGDL